MTSGGKLLLPYISHAPIADPPQNHPHAPYILLHYSHPLASIKGSERVRRGISNRLAFTLPGPAREIYIFLLRKCLYIYNSLILKHTYLCIYVGGHL